MDFKTEPFPTELTRRKLIRVPDREREIRNRRRKVSKDHDGGFDPDRTLSLMCEKRKDVSR